MRTLNLLVTKTMHIAHKLIAAFLYLLFVPALFLSFMAQAQEPTQTVRGTVLDKDNRQPLTGATVVVINGTISGGTVTDNDGKFKIEKVPAGRKTIRVTYVGYKDVLISDVIVNSAKEVVLNIEMVENAVNAKEVVVSAKSSKAQTNNQL